MLDVELIESELSFRRESYWEPGAASHTSQIEAK
jgi:hypothetical protein